jgi:hypothetical protein
MIIDWSRQSRNDPITCSTTIRGCAGVGVWSRPHACIDCRTERQELYARRTQWFAERSGLHFRASVQVLNNHRSSVQRMLGSTQVLFLSRSLSRSLSLSLSLSLSQCAIDTIQKIDFTIISQCYWVLASKFRIYCPTWA